MSIVTKVSFWPKGCDPANVNASSFQIDVEWCGPREEGPRAIGGYRVTQHGFRELSRAGKWAYHVPRFKRWQYRWATLAEASAWAERVVDDVTVNGRTWAEWEVWRETRVES